MVFEDGSENFLVGGTRRFGRRWPASKRFDFSGKPSDSERIRAYSSECARKIPREVGIYSTP